MVGVKLDSIILIWLGATKEMFDKYIVEPKALVNQVVKILRRECEIRGTDIKQAVLTNHEILLDGDKKNIPWIKIK